MAKKPKGKTRKDAATVNILAVKRPPTGVEIPKEYLPMSPYITQDQLADWLSELSGEASSHLDTNEELSPQQYAELGQSILNGLEDRVSERPDPKLAQFMAIVMSKAGSDLYDGVYTQTEVNPVYAIETFLTFRQARLYPPDWVLEWLAKAFDGYIKSEGEEDLNKLLGAKRGKGKTLVFKEANSALAETYLMSEMGILTVAGATIMEAAEMVSAQQEETDPDCLSPDTLAERYSKKGWSKIFKPVKAMSPTVSLDDVKKAFAAYPQLSVPTRFRQTD